MSTGFRGGPNEPQMIPVYFSGAGRYSDGNGSPSGAVGALATVVININLRPQWLTAIRVELIYDIPVDYRNVDTLTYLDRLDREHTMTTELTQSNIVVREAVVSTVAGRRANWQPLASPYPWSGGDNMTMRFRRVTAYPAEIFPTVHVTLEGIMLVKDLPGTNRA